MSSQSVMCDSFPLFVGGCSQLAAAFRAERTKFFGEGAVFFGVVPYLPEFVEGFGLRGSAGAAEFSECEFNFRWLWFVVGVDEFCQILCAAPAPDLVGDEACAPAGGDVDFVEVAAALSGGEMDDDTAIQIECGFRFAAFIGGNVVWQTACVHG